MEQVPTAAVSYVTGQKVTYRACQHCSRSQHNIKGLSACKRSQHDYSELSCDATFGPLMTYCCMGLLLDLLNLWTFYDLYCCMKSQQNLLVNVLWFISLAAPLRPIFLDIQGIKKNCCVLLFRRSCYFGDRYLRSFKETWWQ